MNSIKQHKRWVMVAAVSLCLGGAWAQGPARGGQNGAPRRGAGIGQQDGRGPRAGTPDCILQDAPKGKGRQGQGRQGVRPGGARAQGPARGGQADRPGRGAGLRLQDGRGPRAGTQDCILQNAPNGNRGQGQGRQGVRPGGARAQGPARGGQADRPGRGAGLRPQDGRGPRAVMMGGVLQRGQNAPGLWGAEVLPGRPGGIWAQGQALRVQNAMPGRGPGGTQGRVFIQRGQNAPGRRGQGGPQVNGPGRPDMVDHRRFQAADTDGDGKVSREEFVAAQTAIFDRLDSDNDGVLTPDEFRNPDAPGVGMGRGLQIMDSNQDGQISKEEFRGSDTLFGTLDQNEDGVIDETEIARPPLRFDRAPLVEGLFKRLDANEDGLLDATELQGKAMILEADTNDDQKLDKEEILKALQDDPRALRRLGESVRPGGRGMGGGVGMIGGGFGGVGMIGGGMGMGNAGAPGPQGRAGSPRPRGRSDSFGRGPAALRNALSQDGPEAKLEIQNEVETLERAMKERQRDMEVIIRELESKHRDRANDLETHMQEMREQMKKLHQLNQKIEEELGKARGTAR